MKARWLVLSILVLGCNADRDESFSVTPAGEWRLFDSMEDFPGSYVEVSRDVSGRTDRYFVGFQQWYDVDALNEEHWTVSWYSDKHEHAPSTAPSLYPVPTMQHARRVSVERLTGEQFEGLDVGGRLLRPLHPDEPQPEFIRAGGLLAQTLVSLTARYRGSFDIEFGGLRGYEPLVDPARLSSLDEKTSDLFNDDEVVSMVLALDIKHVAITPEPLGITVYGDNFPDPRLVTTNFFGTRVLTIPGDQWCDAAYVRDHLREVLAEDLRVPTPGGPPSSEDAPLPGPPPSADRNPTEAQGRHATLENAPPVSGCSSGGAPGSYGPLWLALAALFPVSSRERRAHSPRASR